MQGLSAPRAPAQEEGLMRERAFAMDLEDLHRLLKAFNRRGIHFANVQQEARIGVESGFRRIKHNCRLFCFCSQVLVLLMAAARLRNIFASPLIADLAELR